MSRATRKTLRDLGPATPATAALHALCLAYARALDSPDLDPKTMAPIGTRLERVLADLQTRAFEASRDAPAAGGVLALLRPPEAV